MNPKPRVRCSQLPQLLACSGSRTLTALVKPRSGGEGWEGSMGHWTVAHRLIHEQGATGKLEAPQVPASYALPKMSEWIVDWVLRQVKEDFPDNYAMSVEEEFEAEFDRFILVGHTDIFGVAADASAFIGADEKWGYRPVIPADLNDQLLGYLVLGKRAYPQAQKGTFKLYQPRNNEEDGYERVSSVELDGAGLEACVASLEARVNAALDDPMTVNSGMLQCAWCAAAGVCPATRKEFEYMIAQLTPESLAAIKADPDSTTLADVLMASRTVKRAVEDVEEELHKRLAEGGVVTTRDGVKITQKITGGKLTISNPEGAWESVNAVVPPARIPHVITYSKDRVIDEIAAARNIPKGGKGAVTATSIFQAAVLPHFSQGERRLFVFGV